jgi:uncharacterized protein YuzB (UPF0349 family)
MKIKVCCKNLKRCDGKSTVKALKGEFPDVKWRKKDCLGRCGACKKGAIAQVGKGPFLCKADPDTLYAELKKLLSPAG